MEHESQSTKDGKRATYDHIMSVQDKIEILVNDLMSRASVHDASKLESPEKEIFGEYRPKLGLVEYGSPEYKELLIQIKPALDHHYANNSHHPEFWRNGLFDMDLGDLNEMFCDWLAATERMKGGGDIHKSIDINAKRFSIPDVLVSILHNTATRLYKK